MQIRYYTTYCFPRQQWLRERTSILRNMYNVSLNFTHNSTHYKILIPLLGQSLHNCAEETFCSSVVILSLTYLLYIMPKIQSVEIEWNC